MPWRGSTGRIALRDPPRLLEPGLPAPSAKHAFRRVKGIPPSDLAWEGCLSTIPVSTIPVRDPLHP